MRRRGRAGLALAAATALMGFGVVIGGAGAAAASTVGCMGDGSAVTSHSYSFTDPDGTVRTGTSLSQARPGDVVVAMFAINPQCTTADVSLASYTSATTAAAGSLAFFQGQQLFDSDTGTFPGGTTGTLTVHIPASGGVTSGCPNPNDSNVPSGNGANQSGPYNSTCNGSPSQNGNGNGNANGKPCAGCVGNADNKNPPGQLPNATADGNNGYECDNNNGVGKTNPAHTGCGVPHSQTDLAVGSVITTFCPADATTLAPCVFYGHRLAPDPNYPGGLAYLSTLVDSVFLT